MGFTRGQGRLADLGELGGTVKLALWERGIDVMIAPPATLKSAIAENGRADKSEIKAALRQRYGYHITNPDEADALGLMLLGEIRCGKTRLQAHAKRMASVTNCEVIRGQIKLGA